MCLSTTTNMRMFDPGMGGMIFISMRQIIQYVQEPGTRLRWSGHKVLFLFLTLRRYIFGINNWKIFQLISAQNESYLCKLRHFNLEIKVIYSFLYFLLLFRNCHLKLFHSRSKIQMWFREGLKKKEKKLCKITHLLLNHPPTPQLRKKTKKTCCFGAL